MNLSNALEKGSELINHPEPGVRLAAIQALGELGDESAIVILEQLLNDADLTVVEAVRVSLDSLYAVADLTLWSEARLIEAIDKDSWIIQKRAAQELFNRDPSSSGTAYARQQLVWPRISLLTNWATHGGVWYFAQLIELGLGALLGLDQFFQFLDLVKNLVQLIGLGHG